MEYELPPEISKLITIGFLESFRDETIAIFQQNDLNHGHKPGDYKNSSYWSWWVYMEGTSGFSNALSYAFKKHSLIEVELYRSQLDWPEIESFDDQIVILLYKKGLIYEGDPEEEVLEED